VEDVGITLGMAVAEAVGDKKGITRYGHAYVPLDEALSRVVVDFSGRPGLHMDVPFKAGMVGGFDTPLAFEFFQGFANHALVTLHIDGHHTVEDVGITLGMAVAQAVGDKKGLTRYGHAYVPLDEALSRVVIDFSGRPGLHMDVPFKSGMVGGFDTQLTYEFFQGFANHALFTLHIDNLKGSNAHHQCETVFKAFGRALRMALAIDARSAGMIPSTKGSL
jgi:imidazoleglycerol phosphate dehydratase HisB